MRDLSPLDRFPRHLVETGPGSVGNPGTHPILLPSGRRILVLMRSCSRLGEKSWYSPHPAPGRTKNPGTRAERASIRPQIAGTTPNEPPVPVLPTRHAVREPPRQPTSNLSHRPAKYTPPHPPPPAEAGRPPPCNRRTTPGASADHLLQASTGQNRLPPAQKPPRAPTLTRSPRQTKLPAHKAPLTD